MLDVTFYGVRGSTPTPCSENQRYGGNTSCVALEVGDQPPIVFDLGTGLRYWGEALGRSEVQLPDKKEIPDLLSMISSVGRERRL